MKHILITTIAAVILVGCGESQQSAPSPEAKPVEPVAVLLKKERSKRLNSTWCWDRCECEG